MCKTLVRFVFSARLRVLSHSL
uniref:Uncharacterized protein n=1 Tax=Anguilla anguilla TaxID=7936 RepID=A0A0E9SCB7_ANGAN